MFNAEYSLDVSKSVRKGKGALKLFSRTAVARKPLNFVSITGFT